MTTERDVPVTPFVVGIGGGSGSGKSALARALATALGPERVALLTQDAYYHDLAHLDADERAARNFDAPEALDQALFRAHLAALRQGQAVTPPSYCFVTHSRRGLAEPVEPGEVLIVEGILLLRDPLVRRHLDLRIYVDAPESLRVARRIARDRVERGRTAAAVATQCRATVLPAHARWVEPTRVWADLVLVNTGRLSAVAEVATAVIDARLAARRQRAAGARSA
jgi:uridine kinase